MNSTINSLPAGRLGTALLAMGIATVQLMASTEAAPPLGPMNDPTRPPVALQPPAAASSAVAAASAPEPLPRLQAVRISPHEAPSALLDGRLVRAGDTIAGRRVQSIDDQGVTLAPLPRGSKPERLTLLEGASKQPAGSIQIMRNARFSPDAAAPAAAPAEPSTAAGEKPMSVAERIKP